MDLYCHHMSSVFLPRDAHAECGKRGHILSVHLPYACSVKTKQLIASILINHTKSKIPCKRVGRHSEAGRFWVTVVHSSEL